MYGQTSPIFTEPPAPSAADRTPAAACSARDSRGRGPCRRAGSGRRPRRGRRGRTCAAGGRTSRAGPTDRGTSRGGPSRAATIARAGRRRCRPGTSSSRPIAPSACASLLPTGARPCSAAKRTTRVPRSCRARRVERLDRVRAEARLVGEEGRAGPSPGRRAGRARAGGPGSRSRPGRGPRRPAQVRNGLTAASRNSPSRWPPRVVISSPTTTSNAQAAVARDRAPASAASIRSWSVIAMTSSSVLRSTWSRMSTTPAVPSDASVWMCRSARPSARPRGRRLRRPVRGRWRRGPRRVASRSGQIGWKTASHCSGASATIASNAAPGPRGAR